MKTTRTTMTTKPSLKDGLTTIAQSTQYTTLCNFTHHTVAGFCNLTFTFPG